MNRPLTTLGSLAAALVLAGCASVAPDGLRGDVQALTASRVPAGAELPAPHADARAQAQARIGEWLRQPVDSDAAVRIALLNNAGLQARLAQLGVQDAERVQALTLTNPHLTLGRFANGHEREIERQLSFSLLELITLPWRTRWQGLQMEQATLATAQDVLRLAADTRRAWLRAVAAEQVLAAQERMHEAAEAGGELARRMARVGNWSRLQQARELGVQQESAAQLSRARLAAALEREQLTRLMGLWGPQTEYRLPQQLPALPAQASALHTGEGIEATALRERLDLRALRRDLDHVADREGWTGVGSVFGDVGLSYSRNTATEKDSGHSDITRGWELEVPIPLFDWGGAASGRARAEVQRSAALLQDGAVRARSEARAAWRSYRTAWDLAHQQQTEVLPLARFVQDETALRYNGMLASVWELLAQARNATQAVATATQAQRDFWLADTDLQLALTGTSPGALQGVTASSAPTSTASQGH
ncbi:TolC family protein [Paenacidovorax monticola]|uniref:TolC family protein n=1 Tax=Paenacidovorax monticola TaxID=1926868 RepID=A0A7H0HGQ2_9BURK|nr:TolC family protein [Paenacidovorax monticola]QNP59718.1 TolC family protein [Paenacidovorax monticola]